MKALVYTINGEFVQIMDGAFITGTGTPTLFPDGCTMEILTELHPSELSDENTRRYYALMDVVLLPKDQALIPEFGLNRVVDLHFHETQPPLTSTVKGIHFYGTDDNQTVKYDLRIWGTEGEEHDDEAEKRKETRIYNVEERFVFKRN